MNTDVLLFFSKAPDALAAYAALEAALLARWPETVVVVQKSQIAFDCGRRYTFASLRGKRLVVTFGLPFRVEHPRIAQAAEPCPNRWTHHVPVTDVEEIDRQLLAWIAQAHDFAARK